MLIFGILQYFSKVFRQNFVDFINLHAEVIVSLCGDNEAG